MNTMASSISIKDGLAIVVLLCGLVGSYFANQAATDSKISAVNQTAAVTQSRLGSTDDSLDDLKSDVSKLDEKIDALLLSQGLNPNKY